MKTKDQELAILDEAIAKLGQDSYLGPWIYSIRAELKATMASDFFPTITLKDGVEEIKALHVIAEKKRDQMLQDASHRVKGAEKLAQSKLDDARSVIIKAQQSLLAIEERI